MEGLSAKGFYYFYLCSVCFTASQVTTVLRDNNVSVVVIIILCEIKIIIVNLFCNSLCYVPCLTRFSVVQMLSYILDARSSYSVSVILIVAF